MKTQIYLSYLNAIYVFQIKFDLKNLNDTRSFALKRKAKNLYRRGCDLKFAFNQKSKQKSLKNYKVIG